MRSTDRRGPACVRRSVALPPDLVEEARRLAPTEIRQNFNRIVIAALHEFVTRRKEEAFAAAMEAMAADPAIRTECAAIESEFLAAEDDGLGGDR